MKQELSYRRLAIALTASCVLSAAASAAIAPASVFTDNMVLQRGQPLPIWGTADPGAEIEVRLGSELATGLADSRGHWTAAFGPLPANRKPRSLELRSGDSQVTLKNVLVGDVWLCSGQSNMQMTLADSADGNSFSEEHGSNSQIRLLTVPKLFTAEPRTSLEGKWIVATPEMARQFSAVGFSFGATLANSSAMRDVPIGLIDSSFGGTTVEGWIPADDLKAFDPRDLGNSMFGAPAEHHNAMIRPLIPMAIRGVVWYQGESNSDRPAVYAKLLKTLISVWRRDFRQNELPFIVIQLPAYNAPFQKRFFTWIREQQAQVAANTKGVSLVVTYDTHDGSDLHPREKLPIGERAANVARKEVYGEPLIVSGPTYRSHSVDGPHVRVTFAMHGQKLITTDEAQEVRGFQLAGSDGEYRFASARVESDDTVMVSAKDVEAPKTIRFAWGGVPDANLASSSGLPATPFRTDSFPPNDVEFVRVPIHRAVKTPAYKIEIDATGSLRSLGFSGVQFIANELAMNGGSCIPTLFGPRNLSQVREVGPKQLVFRDSEASLQFVFAPDSIQISVDNRSDNEIVFQIAFAPGVSVVNDGILQLKKRHATFRAAGFDRPDATASEELRLKATIRAGATRRIQLDDFRLE